MDIFFGDFGVVGLQPPQRQSLTIYIYIITLGILGIVCSKDRLTNYVSLKSNVIFEGEQPICESRNNYFHTSVDPWDLRAPGVIRDRILLSFKNGRRNKQLISSSWQLAYVFFFSGKAGSQEKPTITNDLLAQIGSVHSRGFGPFSSKSSAKHARCEKVLLLSLNLLGKGVLPFIILL